MARQLGYDAVYGARYSTGDFPFLVTHYFVDFPDREPTIDHMIQIYLAPDKPGFEDMQNAQRLISEIAGEI